MGEVADATDSIEAHVPSALARGNSRVPNRKGRSLRASLLWLIGIPLFVGISVQGAIAVVTNLPYQAALEKLIAEKPTVAPILQANLDEVHGMGPVMQSMSGVVFVLGLLIAWVAAKTFAERFAHVERATERMAGGTLDQPVDLLRDLEFDPLITDLNLMREKMQERLNLEVERTELGKAMELGAEVQRMFLPSHSHLGHAAIRASSVYRPASTCGGDFWFSHLTDEGRLLVFIGDVTGHGVGAAVVTAAVATQVRMQIARETTVDVARLLGKLNDSMLDLCQGRYRMTMAVLDFSADARTLQYHSAGAPPLLMQGPQGKIDTLTVAGVPLGSTRFSSGLKDCTLPAGTRVYVFTDGLIEAERADGRAFGMRRIGTSLTQLATAPVDQVCERMLRNVDDFTAGAAQDDDWTMLTLEVA